MVPVVATLATALPLIIPINALAITATFAGPPGLCPTSVSEKSLINLLNPLYFKNAPNNTKINIYVALTPIPTPKIPWLPQNIWPSTRRSVKPLCPSWPGIHSPKKLYHCSGKHLAERSRVLRRRLNRDPALPEAPAGYLHRRRSLHDILSPGSPEDGFYRRYPEHLSRQTAQYTSFPAICTEYTHEVSAQDLFDFLIGKSFCDQPHGVKRPVDPCETSVDRFPRLDDL